MWLKASCLGGAPQRALSWRDRRKTIGGRKQCIHLPSCVHTHIFLLIYVSLRFHFVQVIAQLRILGIWVQLEAAQHLRLLAELARIQQTKTAL